MAELFDTAKYTITTVRTNVFPPTTTSTYSSSTDQYRYCSIWITVTYTGKTIPTFSRFPTVGKISWRQRDRKANALCMYIHTRMYVSIARIDLWLHDTYAFLWFLCVFHATPIQLSYVRHTSGIRPAYVRHTVFMWLPCVSGKDEIFGIQCLLQQISISQLSKTTIVVNTFASSSTTTE
jgi:hypothetical protein